jgi:cell division protein FtsX
MFKFWRYVTRNVWRNPIRTVLTVFGVGVAVFVVTYLFAIFDSRSQLVAGAASTMLVVQEQDVY